jgi:glycosyltransferase involved in cell wall biosynthesis
LQHDEVTAVGLVDLEASSGITPPAMAGSTDARDQLVLVRLHGQPVAAAHLDSPVGEETRAEIFAAAWRDGQAEILSHINRCQCLAVPTGPENLEAILDDADGTCPELTPPRPVGAAAVILCTVGRVDALTRCLETLARLRCDDCEVIVVDNRPSESQTRELVDGIDSQIPIRYVAEPRPGLSIARNTGVAAAANATYVAFTDDDVVVDESWLAWLLAPFERPDVEVVTGLVMPLRLDTAAQKRFELYSGFGKGVDGDSYGLHDRRNENRFRFLYPYWGGGFGSGNSMAFRRDALLAIGSFDPALGAGTVTGGGEDIAAFSDIIVGGGRLVYEPRSICWHEHRADEAGLQAQVRNYGVGLTAVFWRHLWRDWRFSVTVLRSLPVMARLVRSRKQDREVGRTAADLARIELPYRLLGPWRYMVSRRKVRRG